MQALLLLLATVASNGFIVNTIEGPTDNIPSYIKICHKNDPYLDECVKNSVEIIKPHLKKGIPELNIPPCEPLVLPEVIMNQGKGSVTVQSKYNDIHVYGPSDFTLHEVKVDVDKNRVRIKLSIPRLETVGNYSINGRILMLPISGSGTTRGNYSDIEATALMQGERYEKDNKTFIHIKDLFIDFTIGHATIHLTNLFNGDKELGDAMNQFLNDNWKNVAEEMKPILEKTLGDLFKKFANRIWDRYPMDVLLPS